MSNSIAKFQAIIPKRLRDLDGVTTLCLLGQLVFAVVFIGQEWTALPLGFPTIVAILYVTFVPGLLVLGTVGIDFRRPQTWIYVVATSLVVVMMFGAAASVVHVSHPNLFPPPLTVTWLPFYLLTGTALLTIIHAISSSHSQLPTTNHLATLASREALLALMLVFLAAIGAVFLEIYGTNLVLLFILILCALSPILLLQDDLSTAKRAILLWGVALALLYQRSLIPTVGGGDLSVELHYAKVSLAAEHWVYVLPSARTTSLRITVLHPIYTLLTDLNLLWEIKLIHPLFFSLTAPVVYYITTTQFDKRMSVLATLVYVFAHPFFTLLSLNSRTAQALFFVAVFILAAVDEHLASRARSICLLIAFLGVLFSHYAVAPLFMFVLLVAWLLSHGMRPLLSQFSIPMSGVSLSIVGLSTVVWYIYSAKGNMFELLIGLIANTVVGLLSSDQLGEAGTNSVSLQLPSVTYQFIRYEYIVILLVCCIGLLFVGLRFCFLDILVGETRWEPPAWLDRFTSKIQSVHPWFFALGAGGAMIVPLSFLPGVSFGIARIYMIVMIFLAGFFAVAVSQLITYFPKLRPLISIGLAVMLLLNSGVVAATITHDISPQPNLIRDHIVEEGSEEEAFHLWRRWTPQSDKAKSEWANTYLSTDRQLYRSTVSNVPYYPPPETDRTGGGPRGSIMKSEAMCGGYIYLSSFDYHINEVVVDLNPDFVYYDQSIPLSKVGINTAESVKIYDAGNNAIYIKQCQ